MHVDKPKDHAITEYKDTIIIPILEEYNRSGDHRSISFLVHVPDLQTSSEACSSCDLVISETSVWRDS